MGGDISMSDIYKMLTGDKKDFATILKAQVIVTDKFKEQDFSAVQFPDWKQVDLWTGNPQRKITYSIAFIGMSKILNSDILALGGGTPYSYIGSVDMSDKRYSLVMYAANPQGKGNDSSMMIIAISKNPNQSLELKDIKEKIKEFRKSYRSVFYK